MSATVLLITPPFTQLNTPYPATAYLKGFLNTQGISSFQSDLGIEVTLALFNQITLRKIFSSVIPGEEWSANARRIWTLQESYLQSIDAVIPFLQGKSPAMAHRICQRGFLPEAARFDQLDDLKWAFGNMGLQDKAKHLATMYLEDLSDFIKETVDPHFGFSRYAERLGRSASSFDEMHASLLEPLTFIDELLIGQLQNWIMAIQPQLVCISVPFPGNLYAAFRCGQWIKQHHPNIKVAMGGGFPNTELRSLKDIRVFEFVDFITLDDGEAPILQLVRLIREEVGWEDLKRTFMVKDKEVRFINNAACTDFKQGQVGTPDYSDLWLDRYVSAIEIANPMHSLWSDGRWNKLTMAHGCYWGKCTFCDVSLPYIAAYEPIAASLLCDRMETIIQQTGNNGFHFVDEAAPPSLMKELSLEIIRRKLVVSWWTNIRFEKSFTRDLCLLLKAAGCIAVSGGLEVASDRLLALIQKGITVVQVARVTQSFTQAGIMVHAYLMYGFPTQTAQETIDSLEMVRQLFEAGVLQSAFWHQFAMTVHSPVGIDPEKYQVKRLSLHPGDFANNDAEHEDPLGTDHDAFGFGLKKSLLNYMHRACFDFPLHKWFDFKVPKTTVPTNFIMQALSETIVSTYNANTKVIWLGAKPELTFSTKSKKGAQWEVAELQLESNGKSLSIKVSKAEGEWLNGWLNKLSGHQPQTYTRQAIKEDYEASGLPDFDLFWDNKPVNTLFEAGLLQV